MLSHGCLRSDDQGIPRAATSDTLSAKKGLELRLAPDYRREISWNTHRSQLSILDGQRRLRCGPKSKENQPIRPLATLGFVLMWRQGADAKGVLYGRQD